jgi:hypothetical protein
VSFTMYWTPRRRQARLDHLIDTKHQDDGINRQPNIGMSLPRSYSGSGTFQEVKDGGCDLMMICEICIADNDRKLDRA